MSNASKTTRLILIGVLLLAAAAIGGFLIYEWADRTADVEYWDRQQVTPGPAGSGPPPQGVVRL